MFSRLKPLVRQPLALAGTGVTLMFLILAVIGPMIAPYPYDEFVRDSEGRVARRVAPGADFAFGTDRLGRDVFTRGAPEGLKTVRKSRWQAEIYDLIAAYGQISARTRPVMHIVAVRPVMTLEDAIHRVSELIGQRIDWSTIESFLPEDARGSYRKSALASSFVAALELAKQGRVEIRQKSPFAPLYLRGIEA